MVWVKSELAEELAVVAAWLSALLPWSVSVSIGDIASGSLVELHFPFFLVRFIFANVPAPFLLVLTPWDAISFYGDAPGPLPFMVWTVGAVVVALAFLLSLAMYFYEDRLADAETDPVRLMGGLLLVAAVLHTVASALLQFGALPIAGIPTDGFPGILIPVGVPFQFAFAYILLRVERVEDPTDDTESDETLTDDAA